MKKEVFMASDTRDEILNSAVQLFSKKNYHAVTMTEISNGAGVSKGTLYWYFDSKEELFREIALTGMEYFHDEFEDIAQKDITTNDKIYQLICFVLKTLAEHLNMLDVFRNNVELISVEFKNVIENSHQKNINIVSKIIKQGIKEGVIKSENPTDMAIMILSVLFTPQTKELLDNSTKVEKKINFIYDFIMNGISRKEH
jgi:AcrR family transcriptional regulator